MVLVRDSEKLLRENLEFHLKQGVSSFIITDDRSVDANSRIIEEYVAAGLADRIWEPEELLTVAATLWRVREAIMKVEEIKSLYNKNYAEEYDVRFLESELTAADTQYELHLLGSFLTPQTRWLDVGCGTGYFLSRFPQIDRVGLDLAPAMLERTKIVNPGVEFRLHDFREPIPDWADRFGLVTCMWYAYGYVESMRELSQLIRNLASWTAPSGRCFVPLADPDLLTRQTIPYRQDTGHKGDMFITGILWSYVEDAQTVHGHMVAPNLQYMVEQFEKFFEQVEIIRYPQVKPEIGRRPALIATRKKVESACEKSAV